MLFAWSNDTVVVTFRGSTTAANWIADAMVRRHVSTRVCARGVAGIMLLRSVLEIGVAILGYGRWVVPHATYMPHVDLWLCALTTSIHHTTNTQMWRSAHPGSNFKNTQASWFNSPKIHTGFLRCWAGTGLDRRVLSMLVNLVETSLDPSKLKIYFTGNFVLLSSFINKATAQRTQMLRLRAGPHALCGVGVLKPGCQPAV